MKIANLGDWNFRGGHLYVAGKNQQDMVDLLNEAYRKVLGLQDRPDVRAFTLGYFRTYASLGCWGNAMNGIEPERGVWWAKKEAGKQPEAPVKIL